LTKNPERINGRIDEEQIIKVIIMKLGLIYTRGKNSKRVRVNLRMKKERIRRQRRRGPLLVIEFI
jgi:hypothetical protein